MNGGLLEGGTINVHATAIVVGTIGLLIVGPSGSGKSATALSLIAAAQRHGLFSALVSDDRVDITLHHVRLVARAPGTIKGLIELRGAGIVATETVVAAVLHHVLRPVSPPFDDRIAPENETWTGCVPHVLPLSRFPIGIADPLAVLRLLLPQQAAVLR